ncbi:MAG: hypothetical protein JSV81_03955 [Anaerolineales bacterium]|nr:MAG: hypothetical protein JSV81_03955 [Anaerolineales bacterium]
MPYDLFIMSQMPTAWTRPLLEKLKVAYELAKSNGDKQFVFHDGHQQHDILVGYAKYLIEYLDPLLKK